MWFVLCSLSQSIKSIVPMCGLQKEGKVTSSVKQEDVGAAKISVDYRLRPAEVEVV